MVQSVRRAEILPDGMFALRAHPENWCDSKVLAANTAEAIAVPTGAQYVILSGTVDFYARFNATAAGTAAAVPTDISNGTACVLNPTQRFIGTDVAEISVISESACIVTAEFFK